jgi:hypothetical protein
LKLSRAEPLTPEFLVKLNEIALLSRIEVAGLIVETTEAGHSFSLPRFTLYVGKGNLRPIARGLKVRLASLFGLKLGSKLAYRINSLCLLLLIATGCLLLPLSLSLLGFARCSNDTV